MRNSRILGLALAVILASISSAQQAASTEKGAVDHGRNGVWFRSSGAAIELEAVEDEEGEREKAEPLRFSPPPANPLAGIFGASIFGGYTSVQVNVDSLGRNIPGDAANEPSMTMDPTNRNRLSVGWRQFDNVGSDFRQAGVSSSANGGRSWRGQGNLERGVFRSDPVLASTREGKFYYLSLKNTFFEDIFPSSNGGATWGRYTFATGGDKQWMTVDNTTGPGRGNIYQAWSTAGNNYGGRQFSRSTDEGLTWLDPIFIPNFPVWGTLDVGRNGDLYIGGLANPFVFIRSTNAQNRTQTPVFDLAVPVELGGSIVYGAYINPVGLAGQLWLAADKSNSANGGNIYMLCSVGVDSRNPCDVNFVRSTDGGRTWSRPMRLNDDPRNSNAWHWFGAMGVAPNGRIDVAWNDTRANPGASNSALYFTSSSDGGRTWTKNVQVSRSFNPNVGYPVQQKIGDYIAVVSDNGGANIAYAATHNGEQDVWFVRVPAPLGPSLRASAVRLYQGQSLSGGPAQVWFEDGQSADARSTYFNGSGHIAALETEFTVPDKASPRLETRFVGTAAGASSGFLWIYDNVLRRYVLLNSFPISASGKIDVRLPAPEPASPYISATGQVKVLFRATNPNLRSGSSPFVLRADLIDLRAG